MLKKDLEVLIQQLPQLAKDQRKSTNKFFQKLARRKPKNLDIQVADLHEQVFEEIDCLDCANCCKTTSPIIRDIDVDRIATHLHIRPAVFVEKYLRMDDEGDWVFRQAPCPFLDTENYCSIYEVRPKACKEYPHTNRKNFHQILNLTLKNYSICPAVFEIVNRLLDD